MEKEKVQLESAVSDVERFGMKGKSGHHPSFCRWLVSELENGLMTVGQAMDRFEVSMRQVNLWRERYKGSIVLSLPMMTPEERALMESLEKRLREAEKLLEHARMKNIALETMVDLAEETLKIDIRKKSGPKQ